MSQNIYENWLNTEVLAQYSGEPASLFLILLALEYTKGEATISIQQEEAHAKIFVQKGRIVDARGLGNLIQGLVEEVPKGMGIGDLFGVAMGRGMQHDAIMNEIQERFVSALLSLDAQKIEVLPFVKPNIPMKLKLKLALLLEQGVQAHFVGRPVKRRYQDDLDCGVFVRIPDGVVLARLGLSPVALRMLRSIKSGCVLRDLASSKAEWEVLHMLSLLGILGIEDQSLSSKLSDHASEDQKKIAELKDWLKENQDKEAHVLLELTEPKEINNIVITQKARKLSSKLHPDRFVSYGAQVQALAQRCFELVSKALQDLESEELRAELKARFDAEMRGEVYVSESSEKKSTLLYEKAKFLFRRNKLAETEELIQKAYELNPYNWRLNYLRLQFFHKKKEMSDLEIADQLLLIEGSKGHEKLDILTFAAELYCALEEEAHQKKGKELLKSIRSIDPEFQRAKILQKRLQRQNQSQKPPKEEKKKGFFSSLFRK